MKNLNELIQEYTHRLQQGEIQTAYKAILEFMGRLRADFIRKYPQYDISGIYQGYMDMSYFSLVSEPLKEKGLKIAIVYLHEKGCFQVWLSARNREIARRYVAELSGGNFDGMTVFHDNTNQDAIIEHTLTASPDFEDQRLLTEIIEHGVQQFAATIDNLLIS